MTWKRSRRSWIVLPLIFLVTGSRSSAAQEVLTLSRVVHGALANHPSFAAARAASARAAAGVDEARAARLPTLHLDASAVRFARPMVVAPLHDLDPRQPPLFDETLVQGGISASYTVFDGGATTARVNASRALAEAAGTGEAEARLSLLAESARSYLRVLSLRDLVFAHERRVEAVEQERVRVASLVQEGRSARVGLLRAEAALGAARAELASARADTEVAERELARLMGERPDRIRGAEIQDVGMADASPAPREVLVARAMEGSPEVRRARAHSVAARAGREQARSLRLPRMQIGGRYIEYASSQGLEAGEWQGGVHVSYPLFTGGTRGAAMDRAAAELQGSEAELALAEMRVVGAVDRALAALEASRARTAALQAGVAQAEEVVRIERLALDHGAGLQADYLGAVAELFRTRAAMTEARYAGIGARIELARLTGELSAAWLADQLGDGR